MKRKKLKLLNKNDITILLLSKILKIYLNIFINKKKTPYLYI